MKFSAEPRQLSDGRFFVKAITDDTSGERVFVQLNNTTMITELGEDSDVTISVDEKSLQRVKNVDNAAVVAAKEHSTDWFKKDLPEKTINAAYSPSLTVENTMNVSKLVLKGQNMTKVYDHERNEMDAMVPSGVLCDALLEFAGLWFLKKSFGPVWRIVQVRLKPPPKEKKKNKMSTLTYMFQDDDETVDDHEPGPESESDDDDYA